MKSITTGVFCILLFCITITGSANTNLLHFSRGAVSVEYNETTGTADIAWNGNTLITQAFARVKLGNTTVTSRQYTAHTQNTTAFNNPVFGPGMKVEIVSTDGNTAAMRQIFYLYDNTRFFETEVTVEGTNVSSNWMSPLVVETPGGVAIGPLDDGRALKVPWDNDGFVRYNAGSFNRNDTSYEVAAFYDNTSRNGLIVGSVTHDTWKTGISFTGSADKLDTLRAFGGITDDMTRDSFGVSHGAISGNTIASPRIFIGYFSDWRDGMERFGDANAAITPPLQVPENSAVPCFGWNSWGELQFDLNEAKAIAVSDFFKNNLQDNSFNSNGTVYINLDAGGGTWSNWIQHCRDNSQKVGIYMSPFANWGSARSNCLKDNNGNYLRYDNAYCYDPTHPDTRNSIKNFINNAVSAGVDYIKIDFTVNGALEAASWYDPSVKTGIQAYSQGMRYLDSCANGRLYLNYSISPLFPFQYAHGRRIACDSWGSMSNTKYTLNSITYGWWMGGGRMYYNDPDHMTLRNSENEAKSRITSGAISGVHMLLGDDFSNPDRHARAIQYCTNPRINAVARLGKPFRPIEGNTKDQPADAFVMRDSGYFYIAVFNFNNNQTIKRISFDRIGIQANTVMFEELWTGSEISASGNLETILDSYDCALFKSQQPTNIRIFAELPQHGHFLINSSKPFFYDLRGRSIGGFMHNDRDTFPAVGVYVWPKHHIIIIKKN